MNVRTLRGKIGLSLVIGLVVVVAIGLFSDIRAVGDDFARFQWATLPAILGFTLLNYGLRWAKWEYYLRYLKLGAGVNRLDSGLMFTAGMIMSVTPGKIGEVFKSYLLRRVNGTPVSVSAPIVLAERLTDGLAMLLLMALGLTLYPPARPLFVVLLVGSVIGIAILQHQPLFERLCTLIERLPLGQKLAPKIRSIYESTHRLLNWRILLISTIISFISWGFECLAFYYVLTGLGIEGSPLLLLQATFIFAFSTLAGLVSFLPGGLGVSEVSSVGLIVGLVGAGVSLATTATIIIRFCTLWFGVLVGVGALAWFGRRHRDEGDQSGTPTETDDPAQTLNPRRSLL